MEWSLTNRCIDCLHWHNFVLSSLFSQCDGIVTSLSAQWHNSYDLQMTRMRRRLSVSSCGWANQTSDITSNVSRYVRQASWPPGNYLHLCRLSPFIEKYITRFSGLENWTCFTQSHWCDIPWRTENRNMMSLMLTHLRAIQIMIASLTVLLSHCLVPILLEMNHHIFHIFGLSEGCEIKLWI